MMTNEPLNFDERQRLRQCQLDLHEASKPYISIISDVYSLVVRSYIIISKDGEIVEHGYNLTPKQQATIDEARRLWAEHKARILESYGLKEPLI